MAPVTAPGALTQSVNLFLRQELDLFACVRPCRLFEGVKSPFAGSHLDLVIIRENTEDLYLGLDFEANRRESELLRETINQLSHRRIKRGSGLSIKPITYEGSTRIVEFAFDYARRNGRKKVTAVHKANLMRATDGLFLQAARDVARQVRDIEFEDKLIDSLCMQLVMRPESADVLVTTNFYGDILSDLAAGMVGGLSYCAGANVGDQAAVFEALHGPATRFKGLGKVNPMALVLAGVMMLRHLGEDAAAERLGLATASVIRDMNVSPMAMPEQSPLGTESIADAIIARLSALKES
jgi:isocitrate dehydrogenase (NAD+)